METYMPIAFTTLSSPAASVTFSGISNTYKDLVLRLSVRSARAANSNPMEFILNGDSSTLYSTTNLYAIGSSATSDRISNNSSMYSGSLGAQNVTANTFTSLEVYIPSYTTSQNKSVSVSNAYENNSTTTNFLGVIAGLYRSNTAVSSIQFTGSGFNFEPGSTFDLYGIV